VLNLVGRLFHHNKCTTACETGCETGCGCGGTTAPATPAAAPAAAPAPAVKPAEEAAPLPIAPKADPSASLMRPRTIYQASRIVAQN
jgi:hypothetical protein